MTQHEHDAFWMVEKTPLSSKKFIAYLLGQFCWTITMLFAIAWDVQDWALLAMVLVNGFLQVAYIGGQAWLDRYVRVAQIFSVVRSKRATVDENPAPEA
jgi:hypothetical protein